MAPNWRASSAPTLPHRYEHADTRAGALNLVAAFETRLGPVDGPSYERTRPRACRALLEHWDPEIAAHIRTMPLMGDHVSTPHGEDVTRWFATPPRCVVHFTPVAGSGMTQVDQWFSILQRTRLRLVDFPSNNDLRAKRDQFLGEWNQHAQPFNWSTTSAAKVMAQAPALAA